MDGATHTRGYSHGALLATCLLLWWAALTSPIAADLGDCPPFLHIRIVWSQNPHPYYLLSWGDVSTIALILLILGKMGLVGTIRHSIVASIPACHAGDRGSIPRDGIGDLAQLVARVLSMHKVAGSIPAISILLFASHIAILI